MALLSENVCKGDWGYAVHGAVPAEVLSGFLRGPRGSSRSRRPLRGGGRGFYNVGEERPDPQGGLGPAYHVTQEILRSILMHDFVDYILCCFKFF